MTPRTRRAENAARASLSRGKLALFVAAAVLVCSVLVALGVWQVYRLSWKLDLIARVDARVHAAAVPIPGPDTWAELDASSAEYRHVVAHGRFDHGRETLVQAVTQFGPGFWVLTPLATDQGFTVLVNRGFVPSDHKDPSTRVAGQTAGDVVVAGLLRVTEPGGAFLRANDPPADRWFSRDVAAITKTRGLGGRVAPYFVDADSTPNPGGLPVGGLTVVAFPNNHFVYALTWFALAALLAGATAWLVRDSLKSDRLGAA